MLSSTKAIVLKATKYAENSLIVKCYTEQFGLKTYIIGGVHGKKSKAAFFLPLTLLELHANHKEGTKLVRPKEIQLIAPLLKVHTDLSKGAVLMFLNEVIYKAIQEEEANQELFTFLHKSILELEIAEPLNPNFHLKFLLDFTRYLGFYPQGKWSLTEPYFDLQEGIFTRVISPLSLDTEQAQLLHSTTNAIQPTALNREERKTLLSKLMLYFELHLEGFKNIKSLDVLYQIHQ